MPFDVTSGLNMAEERISKLEDMMLKTSKREKEKKKKAEKNRAEYPKIGITTKGVTNT